MVKKLKLKNKYIYTHISFHITGYSFVRTIRLGSCCQTNLNPVTLWTLRIENASTSGHQGALWGHGSVPAAWLFEEEEEEEKKGGALSTVLTGVWVSLLRPGRTGGEGELALHGRLGFPFLPQQLTPVQLRSFGKRGQLVFALSEAGRGRGERDKTRQ